MVIERHLNSLFALILAAILWGALAIQFFKHEEPCPLCLLQRLGMLGMASGALMNVRFGPRKSHYGLSLFSAVFGGFVALRQMFLHVCPQFPKFGVPFWGLSLYTWSFITFAASIFYIGLLLLFFDHQKEEMETPRSDPFGLFAFIVLFLVALTNIFSTLWLCGLSACDEI